LRLWCYNRHFFKTLAMKKILLSIFTVFSIFFITNIASATSISGGTSLDDPYCVSFDSEAEYDANISTNYTLGFFSTDNDGYVIPFTPIATTFELHSGEPQLGPLCFPITNLYQYNLTEWPNALNFGPYEPGTQSYMFVWELSTWMQAYIEDIENNPPESPATSTGITVSRMQTVANDFNDSFVSVFYVGVLGVLLIASCMFGIWLFLYAIKRILSGR